VDGDRETTGNFSSPGGRKGVFPTSIKKKKEGTPSQEHGGTYLHLELEGGKLSPFLRGKMERGGRGALTLPVEEN